MGGPGRWWRGKSTPAKVEWYTRWTFHSFAVIEVAALTLQLFGQVEPPLAGLLLLFVGVHAAVCAVTASVALDWTRGLRAQPTRMVWTLGVVTALTAVVATAIAQYGPDADGVDGAAGGVYGVTLLFGTGVMSLGVRGRRPVCAIVVGFAAGLGLVSFALGLSGLTVAVSSLLVLLGGGLLAFTSLFSGWLLNAVYELDEARETRARLAVAEERLRFGRDLHDVMGRNLAVIALKSELSVQLARRGRPEAVEQMIEVQRIARESQREVRDVVRGYRDADLGVELAGARGVLTAAGIICEVSGETVGLPGEVQSALAWVVREATTNVLRHGDAGRCSVGIQVREGHVVLTVENDGVSDEADASVGRSGGSGLAGLRERLAAVDGTLVAGPTAAGVFRLVAEVPLASAEVAS